MTKQEFSDALRKALTNLPPEDLERSIDFYQEMIDDRMEDGIPEEEAVAAIGSVAEVSKQILADHPNIEPVTEKVPSRRKLKAWEIVLLAVGSPIWLSLLIAGFAVALSLYVVLWALVICLWAVSVSIGACAVGGTAGAVVMIATGNVWGGVCLFGGSVFCAGLAIQLFWLSKLATIGSIKLSKKLFIWIKSLFTRKEVA